MTRAPLWPAEDRRTFTDALLSDPPAATVLGDLLAELEASEPVADRALHPATRRGRLMFRAQAIMGRAAFAAATPSSADALTTARRGRSTNDLRNPTNA